MRCYMGSKKEAKKQWVKKSSRMTSPVEPSDDSSPSHYLETHVKSCPDESSPPIEPWEITSNNLFYPLSFWVVCYITRTTVLSYNKNFSSRIWDTGSQSYLSPFSWYFLPVKCYLYNTYSTNLLGEM